MYLGNPLLPLSLSAKEALGKIEAVLVSKNWKDFDSGELKLVLVPYFLYNYHYHTEKEVEGKKIVESSKDGLLLLNGSSLAIEENLVKLIQKNLGGTNQEVPQIEHEVKKTSITKATQEHILKVKTAQFFKIPKDNVIVSNVKQLMFPIYKSFITLQKKTYEITINAINGDVYETNEVPTREKGFMEITQETLRDLRDPKAWLTYTKGLAIETGKFLADKNESLSSVTNDKKVVGSNKERNKLSFLSSKKMLVIIIILALFLIYLALA